jgi:iron complex transport system substrate-binding protein
MSAPNSVKHVVALLALLLCAACEPPREQNSGAVVQAPKRIVSISPNVTEILYGIGAWPQVVAVSQYCDYPKEVNDKPRVSGWDKTNLEQLSALKPDLVIGVTTQAPFLEDKLNELGIRALFLKTQTLADVYAAIQAIGNAIANRERVKVLCVVDRIPGTIRELYTATRGSYLDELITIAGGESIAPAADQGWGKITKEAAVSLNPQVIIDMVQDSKGDFGEDPIAVWQELAEVRAVQHKRIYPIRDALVIHPSQFVGHTARVFASVIHPEAFANDNSTDH